jgi:hypothetical protein
LKELGVTALGHRVKLLIMSGHKFKIGQLVNYLGRDRLGARRERLGLWL